jgi:peptidoglycan pentaglycine glycine transferase (the first glycine)
VSQQQASTTYKVREVRDVSPSEWDGWLRDSPGGGHVLQSYAWGEFKRRFGWKPMRLVLEREGEVVGAGQFLAYNTIPIPGLLMYCSKGPWLSWEDEEAVRAFFRGAASVAGRAGAHTLKIEPEVLEDRKDVEALLDDIGFHEARYALNFDTTVTVDLSPPEEELLARMRKSTRYGVRKAAREGVEVVEPEDFEGAWETFYGWMEDTAERKSDFTIRRPREYLHAMMRTMRDAGRGHLSSPCTRGGPSQASSSSPSARSTCSCTGPRVPRSAATTPTTSCSGRSCAGPGSVASGTTTW